MSTSPIGLMRLFNILNPGVPRNTEELMDQTPIRPVPSAYESVGLPKFEDLYREGPATSAYKEALMAAPERQPLSKMEKLLYIIGSTFSGPRNAMLAREMRDRAPMEDWQRRVSSLGLASKQERETLDDRARYEMGAAQLGSLENQRREARAEADRKAGQWEQEHALSLSKEEREREEAKARQKRNDELTKLGWANVNARRAGKTDKLKKVEFGTSTGHKGAAYIPEGDLPSFGTIPGPLSSTAQEIIDQSKSVKETVKHLDQLLTPETLAAVKKDKDAKYGGLGRHFGPLMGRQTQMEILLGSADPGARGLHTGIQSLVALMPKLHGYRGGVIAHKQFEDAIGSFETNPDAFRQSLRELDKVADRAIAARVPKEISNFEKKLDAYYRQHGTFVGAEGDEVQTEKSTEDLEAETEFQALMDALRSNQ